LSGGDWSRTVTQFDGKSLCALLLFLEQIQDAVVCQTIGAFIGMPGLVLLLWSEYQARRKKAADKTDWADHPLEARWSSRRVRKTAFVDGPRSKEHHIDPMQHAVLRLHGRRGAIVLP
jgi:hypothetical protein